MLPVARTGLAETRTDLAATTARLTASVANIFPEKYVAKRVYSTTTRKVARVSAELDHLRDVGVAQPNQLTAASAVDGRNVDSKVFPSANRRLCFP